MYLFESPTDNRSVNSNATKHAMYLYGLIHARYILTVAGLEAMVKLHEDVFNFCDILLV